MIRVEPTRNPPKNFDAFVDEVARGLSDLYGAAAADDYRKKAPIAIVASVAHPAVRTWVALEGESKNDSAAAAMLVASIREGVGHITFVHVLKERAGQGIEQQLIERAVAQLKGEHIDGIAAEPVALCPLDLDMAFAPLGFTRIERQLMIADLTEKPFSSAMLSESVSAEFGDYGRVADIIVEAYRDHPGRELHSEVRTVGGAEAFVRSAADGAYGLTRASFIRVTRRLGEPVAAVLGCEAAPGVGFVLQVVARPAFRGQGLGTRLILELAHAFREAGLERIALGVTVDNPARRLYERLGFRKILPVNAYVWWK